MPPPIDDACDSLITDSSSTSMPPSGSAPPHPGTFVKKALYLFAGPARHSSIGHMLRVRGWDVVELDILRDRRHDLTRKHNQQALLQRINANEFGLLLTSPPCDTFTRVKFANTWGPAPTRCREFPRGVPWATPAQNKANKLGNALADFSYQAVLAQLRQPPPNNCVVQESPEDLGVVLSGKYKGIVPATIWQFPQHQQCVDAGAVSLGLRQSDFGMPYAKPTRLLLKVLRPLPASFFVGMPVFNANNTYAGPIPRSSTHSTTLAKTSRFEKFRTTGTAAWPSELCKTLVELMSVAPQGTSGDFSISSPPSKRQNRGVSDEVSSAEENPLLIGGQPPTPRPESECYPIHNPPQGWNPGGRGTARKAVSVGKCYDFHDGAGLCSPGRFDKQDRIFPMELRWEQLRKDIFDSTINTMDGIALSRQLTALYCGKDMYFNNDWPVKVRGILHDWLKRQAGDYAATEPFRDEGQPFYLDLIGGLLREATDPDFAILERYKDGVDLGVTEPLPHTPAVFELQTSWNLKDDPLEEGVWHSKNYNSLEPHLEDVRRQFEEEIADQMMGKCTLKEFKTLYPGGYAIASLAVLVEKDKKRVLHDGSNRVRTNYKIKTRDKLRTPGPREKAYLLNGFKERKRIGVSLLGDVSKAHRRVKVKPADYAWQGCTLEDITEQRDETVIYYNKVGSFGMASAAYWWGRLGACLIRLCYVLLGPCFPLDMLLYADDLEVIAEHAGERPGLLLVVIILLAVGTPIKWSKFRGGYELVWIGYHFSHRLYAIGLSEARAQWLITWIQKTLTQGSTNIDDFGSVIGRLGFAAMALLYDKPFLGILYAWHATVSRTRTEVARLPWAVAMVLHWLARRISEERGRLQPSDTIVRPRGLVQRVELFRSDAKATEAGGWIGGWEYLGGQPAAKARWFAFEVRKEVFPWLFSKGDPKRVIAALELLGTLVCIMLFAKEGDYVGSITGTTDNQTNTYVVKKFLTTKFPGTILLMELSEQLRKRKATLHLDWLCRSSNVEADDLTNGNFSKFTPSLRIDVDQSALPFSVLWDVQEASQQLYDQLTAAKDKSRRAQSTPEKGQFVRKRLAVDKRLKWKSPW